MSQSEKRQRTQLLLGILRTPEEKKLIQEKAEASGLSVGEFLRRCALGRRITPKTDVKLISELSKTGLLQKQLFNEGKGVHSQEYSDILVALKKAILKIDFKE
ncbi:plasmid mobilization protein MobA [Candidatus Williamhamiltonella defendens]|uniref:plasmid mobilization protein MobA n=1 Tax=Candidatus Williamhamiltonella defendens TaxID=138072 RepID=UPI001583D773|nr:plasmid mobilization protein MobA [Candidatus Hamiltonella defensa]